VAALVSAGLLTAAALAPAPPGAVPLLALVVIGFPVLAAWELPAAVMVLRLRPRRTEALDHTSLWQLRRVLEELPETEHPHGY
jgi:hypothetical protein